MAGLPIGTDATSLAARSATQTLRARGERALARWRDYVGVLSLIGCPSVLVAFLAVRYGLHPLAGARAVIALYALGVVPGYLVQRYAFGLWARTPFETLCSSLLIGTLLTPLLWYTLYWFGLSAVFYPLMFALAASVPLACGWHRDTATRLKQLVAPTETPMLWLAVALGILWSWQLDLVAFRDGQVVILPHNDHLLHTSLIAELARGVPPATVPFIAGADKWAYHLMSDVWCDLIRRVAGLDARDAYFYLALPLRYVFVALACYLALVRRFGRSAAMVGAACVLAFVGYHGSRYLFTNWLLTYLYWNFPCALGLAGAFLILYYVSAMDRARPRGALLGVSILSALLLWYKANFALAVVPAVTVLSVFLLARRRDYRWLTACVGVQVFLVGVRYLDLSTADLRATLAFEPFRFIRHLWWEGTVWLKGLDGSGWVSLPALVLTAVRRNVDALPALLKWPAVFVLCMVYLFHLGIIVAVYARIRCGFGRLRSQSDPVDVLMLLILLFCGAGFVLFPVHDVLVWNVSKHVFALVYALLFALMGPVLCDLAGRMPRRGGCAIAVTTALLAAAFVGNAYALGRKALGPNADVQDVISTGQYDCYRYVEAATPHDAMILQPRFEYGLMTASMLTQRRVVLEWATVWASCFDVQPIRSDLEAFYGGTGPSSAVAILDRYDVDYVVADASLPREAGYESFLTEVFRSDGAAVFSVQTQATTTCAARGVADERSRHRRDSAGR